MREAAVPGYRLSKAKPSVRVLTTLAVIAVFLGLVAAAVLTISKTGLSAQSVKIYYLGAQYFEKDSLDDLLAPAGRSVSELLEITHMHLMGGSVLLFLLCHLLSVCEMSEKQRIVWYSLSFTSFLLTFSLPWMIIYLHPFFAIFFAPAVIILLLSLLALCFFPIREMWFR